jgi:hypothetical protein
MPRDGALTLSDVFSPTLSIVCEPCNRHVRYSVPRLVEEYGDAKLTNLLETLASCPKTRSPSIHDQCKVVYEGSGLARRRRCSGRRRGGSLMTANRLLPAAIAALALAGAAHAQETGSHVASTRASV